MKNLTKMGLKSLVAQNNSKRVIENLFTLFSAYIEKNGEKEVSDYYDQLILISGKLNGINQDFNLGIIDNNFVRIEKSKINYSLINLINEIPEKAFTTKEVSPAKSPDLRGRVINELDKNGFEFDIFLSFSSKDREMARNIWEELRGYGFKVFLSDESLKYSTGESFFEKIQHALVNSKHFVLICSPNSMESDWVKTEYETFYNEFYIGKKDLRKLIIIKGQDFTMSLVPLLLRRLQIASEVKQVIETIIDTKPSNKELEEKRAKEQEELNELAKKKKALEQKVADAKQANNALEKEAEELKRKVREEKKIRQQEELERKAREEKKKNSKKAGPSKLHHFDAIRMFALTSHPASFDIYDTGIDFIDHEDSSYSFFIKKEELAIAKISISWLGEMKFRLSDGSKYSGVAFLPQEKVNDVLAIMKEEFNLR